MVPFLAIAGVGIAVGLGLRALGRQQDKVVRDLKRARESLERRAPMTLEQDPDTGIYRPRRNR